MTTDEELQALRERVRKLRREIDDQRRNNEKRNRQLDALRFVWCDGGCVGGVARWTEEEITAEIVAEAILNTLRLYHWYVSRAGKDMMNRVRYWDGAKQEIRDMYQKMLDKES